MVGVLGDAYRHATPAFKREGDMVVVIGKIPSLAGEPGPSEGDLLAGSEYLEIVHGKVAGLPPRSNLLADKEVADLVRELVRSGLVDTAHDISGGGEAVALAEMAIEGGIGFDYRGEVDIGELRHETRAEIMLFGETNPDFIVAIPEERWDDLQDALAGVAYDLIGTTGGDRFRIGDLIDVKLSYLAEAYERDLFEQHAPEGGHIG
jgi:phosphoribosylformylglycinamidine synthase